MADEVNVILDLSDEVQTLLEQQDIDLYQELQQALPSLRIVRGHDPASSEGSRDIVQILQVLPGVIGALTPLILAILKQITPPNRAKQWVIEETETRRPDGTVIIQRKQVRASDEQRPWITPVSSDTISSTDPTNVPSQHTPDNQP
jgi:hypothetical protein